MHYRIEAVSRVQTALRERRAGEAIALFQAAR